MYIFIFNLFFSISVSGNLGNAFTISTFVQNTTNTPRDPNITMRNVQHICAVFVVVVVVEIDSIITITMKKYMLEWDKNSERLNLRFLKVIRILMNLK